MSIFPCSGTPSPILEMKALVSFLSKKYTVVTVEGFGSGQSDNPNTVRTVQNIAKEVHSVLQQFGFTQYSIISDIPTVLYSMSYIQEYPNEVKSLILIDMTSLRSFMKQLIFKDTSLFARLRYLFRNTVFAKKCTRILAKISLLRVKGYVYSKHDIFTYELLSVLQLSRDFSPEITAKRQNDTSM